MATFTPEECLKLRLAFQGTLLGEHILIVPDEWLEEKIILPKYVNERNVVNNALSFYKELFPNINESVQVVPMNISDIDPYSSVETISERAANNLISKINDHIKIMSYSDFSRQKLARAQECNNGGVTVTCPILHYVRGDESKKYDFMYKQPCTKTGIMIGTDNNCETVAILIHELGHVLIDRHTDIYSNYYDSEVISQFLELLYYYKKQPEMLDKEIPSLINYPLRNNIDENTILDSVEHEEILKSCTSYPKAIALLDLYITSTTSIQQEILSDISQLFNKELTLDEFFKKHEIDSEKSNAVIQKYIGYYRKK